MKDKIRLRKIYDRTNGYCHLCHKKLAFTNHGKYGAQGAWQIEHSIPKANGGTDHLNNLYAACISCNIKKGVSPSKNVRRSNGVSRAPYNKNKSQKIRNTNTLAGAAGGALLGSVFGPGGTIVGGILGSIFGESNSPKK